MCECPDEYEEFLEEGDGFRTCDECRRILKKKTLYKILKGTWFVLDDEGNVTDEKSEWDYEFHQCIPCFEVGRFLIDNFSAYEDISVNELMTQLEDHIKGFMPHSRKVQADLLRRQRAMEKQWKWRVKKRQKQNSNR